MPLEHRVITALQVPLELDDTDSDAWEILGEHCLDAAHDELTNLGVLDRRTVHASEEFIFFDVRTMNSGNISHIQDECRKIGEMAFRMLADVQ